MSDQCAHTTKVAVFGDESNTTFKDSKEFFRIMVSDRPSCLPLSLCALIF